MEVEIVNLRFYKPSKPYDFYIDMRSPVGNPFHAKTGRMTLEERDDVCDAYDGYFKLAIKGGNVGISTWLNLVMKALRKHGKVRLFCWCVPLRCHGEIIKKWLEENYEDQKESTQESA
jgi:hypothetical protein